MLWQRHIVGSGQNRVEEIGDVYGMYACRIRKINLVLGRTVYDCPGRDQCPC